MKLSELKAQIRPQVIIITTLAASFIYLFIASYMKWGDLIVDTGRELWVPQELLHGRHLYSDIFYPFGFLAPYCISAIYALFGIKVEAAIICGATVTLITSVYLYKITRTLINRLFATLTVMTFFFVFAFGFYCPSGLFNFILPYSFASTFSAMLLTATTYYFLKAIGNHSKQNIVYWAAGLTLLSFARPEMALPAWFVYSAMIAVYAFKNDLCKKNTLITIMSPAALSLVGYYIFSLITKTNLSTISHSIFGYITTSAQNPLALLWMGLDYPVKNIIRSIYSLSSHIMVITALYAGSLLVSSKRKPLHILASIAGLSIIAATIFSANNGIFHPDIQYRCLTLLLPLQIIICGTIYLRKNNNYYLSVLSISLLASTTLIRILLSPTPFQYGFYLLVIPLVCYYIFFTKLMGEFLETQIPNANKIIFSIALTIFFSLNILSTWHISQRMYETRNISLVFEKGKMLYPISPVTINVFNTIDYITKNTESQSKIAIIPEGVSIAFFANRDMPLKHYNFVPPELDRIGNDGAIKEIADANIDYIVITSRDAEEYGYTRFGIDYGQKLFAWINKNYNKTQVFGSEPFTPNDYGIALYKRK